MSTIALEGMTFYAYHGEYLEENKLGGQYSIDVYIKFELNLNNWEDNLSDTVNYETVYKICSEEMQIYSKLIETVGNRILNRLSNIPAKMSSIQLRISKMHPPLNGLVNRAYIELEKTFG